LKTELKLLIAVNEELSLKLRTLWSNSHTKKFDRKTSDLYICKGLKIKNLIIQSRFSKESKKITTVFPEPKDDLNKVINTICEKIGLIKANEIMVAGNVSELRPFLPREPRISSRYQPLININASWELLIRNEHQLHDFKFTKDLINELTSLIWNFNREVSSNGRLCTARKMYKRTWRDPWTKHPCRY